MMSYECVDYIDRSQRLGSCIMPLVPHAEVLGAQCVSMTFFPGLQRKFEKRTYLRLSKVHAISGPAAA